MIMNRLEKEIGNIIGRANYYLSKYYSKSPLLVLSKLVFFILKRAKKNVFIKEPVSNTWYKLDKFTDKDTVLPLEAIRDVNRNWNIFNVRLKGDEHAFFSIDRALKINPNLKGVWLVFFMGIGDYFYANRFLKLFKEKYKTLEINAFVSQNFDRNNSPLVGKLLELDPNITKVAYYDGKPAADGFWKNYDYSDCFSKVSEDYVLCPLIYEHAAFVHSRLETLCETFGLELPILTLPPLVYRLPSSVIADSALKQIVTEYGKNNCKGVVFFQLSSRSSHSAYNDINSLLRKFVEENYFVVSAEPNEIDSKQCYTINIKDFSINDSIYLLSKLKERYPTFCVTLVSAFWSISSALNIPNLGIQHIYDACLKTVVFPNIFVISKARYEHINCSRSFIYKPDTDEDQKYPSPEKMWNYFLLMKKAWEGTAD